MTTDAAKGLYAPLASGDLRLELLTGAHREGLRAACAADREIWAVYPYSMQGAHFDAAFETMLGGARQVYAIFNGDELAGCTSWYNHDSANRSVYIGGTFIAPAVRGSGFNTALKRLMIGHALACGIDRIVFEVDTRNTRSCAAVLKLGAQKEGVLRRNRITWTGFVRDTAVFSLLRDEAEAYLAGTAAAARQL